ncbi:MAG: hypothetical protein ACJA0N_000736 [Pseudohongiellaceae bacterium]|jgi:hypothetical protein
MNQHGLFKNKLSKRHQLNHFHHVGFDHRALCKKAMNQFTHIKTAYSPLKIIGVWAIPEVYYIFKKSRL